MSQTIKAEVIIAMPEQQIEDIAHAVESKIKTALLEKNMTQVELANLIGENR